MNDTLIRAAALLLSALPLSACALLSAGSAPANELYVLHAKAPAESQPLNYPVSVMVTLPQVAAGLNTARIAIADAPNHLTYYTGAAWAQPLPLLAQGFAVDALQQSGRFKSVSSDQEGVAADINLLLDLSDFEVNTLEATTVRLRMVAKLVDGNSHRVLASFPIEKTVTPEGNTMAAIVAAFNAALAEGLADVIRGLLTVNLTHAPA